MSVSKFVLILQFRFFTNKFKFFVPIVFDFGFGGSGHFRFLFRSFRWFRWFRSGGFVPVVSGFSTCHIEMVGKKVGAGIGILKRIKPYVPANTLISIYNALIQPYFDYCSPLLGVCNKTLRDNLQKFQNRAARIIAGASYEIRSADVLRTLDWENLETRWHITKA